MILLHRFLTPSGYHKVIVMHDIKDIISKVKKIEISTKRLVDGVISGNYHSIFKGQGIEFSELREYRHGDDIRAIDWNVTARYNQPFIKEFIEERDLRIYIVMDVSASSNFGNQVQKHAKAIELAASLMFSALRNNDANGLFLFTDTVETHIPARKGKRHVMKLISTLVAHDPLSKKTNITGSLKHIANALKKRSILFIISDFRSTESVKELSKTLALLRNKHDVIAISIDDAREYAIPDVGLIELEDEETGEQMLVDTSDDEFRNAYASLMKRHKETVSSQLKKAKVDEMHILTDESFEIPLKRFFKTRKRKVHA